MAGAPDALAATGHNHRDKAVTAKSVAPHARNYKLDDELTTRATEQNPRAVTQVIVTLVPGAKLPNEFKTYATGRGLGIINGQVLDLPNGVLKQIAAHPSIFRVHYDRPAAAHNYRTSIATGARYVRQMLGYNGAGIGVAVIDSGITSWHDDMTTGASTTTQYPYGNQRVAAFVDFVNGQTQPYDDNGHGTHVAGTVLGNGRDSEGTKAGMAPAASLVSLKVLDANGGGTISSIIAALDWVLANHDQYHIRVVNMSIGAGIHESYLTDPLTLAAKRVVDAGVVVVAAAGNVGKNAAGLPQYGGITAPGNAPWVLTVGASSTNGTFQREDDTMASFSSRGPSYIDYGAKPDLVAPGMGTSSLAAPGSNFYTNKAMFLQGTPVHGNEPYLILSGTSMAAPVVSGTVALMLQANPKLTPNAVKAILEYTAQTYPGYNALTEGAGFLNTVGAIRLARFYATAHAGATVPSDAMWSKHIIWGNHMLAGGYIRPSGSAWRPTTTWGATKADDNGDNIVWGSACADPSCDHIVLGSDAGDNIVWGSSAADNIVWGSSAADNIVWGSSVDAADNIVWGSAFDDNIVWGSDCGGADCDNIVWGSVDPADNIVWGTADAGDNIVWGSSGGDNIVWGSSDDSDNIVWGSSDGGDNIVWGSADGDNIVWGSSDDSDNIVWGSSDGDNIVWGSSATSPVIWSNAFSGWHWSGFGAGLFDALTDSQIFGFTTFAPAPPWSPPADTNPTTVVDPSTVVGTPTTDPTTTTDPTATTTTDPTATTTTDPTATTTTDPTATTMDPTATTTTDTTTTTPVDPTSSTSSAVGGF